MLLTSIIKNLPVKSLMQLAFIEYLLYARHILEKMKKEVGTLVTYVKYKALVFILN